MIRIATGMLLGLLATIAPRTASAAPDWVGDFETGDLSQWSQFSQSTGNIDHVGVTQEVVYEGEWAGRIELAPTDISPGGLTRNEIIHEPGAIEDTERYYSLSIRRESAWGDSYHLLWFWEGNPVFANVISLNALGQTLEYRSYIGSETEHWNAPFTPDVWHDFVLHVYWSADPSTGFIELYYDGEIVVPLTNVATMHGPGVGNCMHAGVLRDENITETEVVYFDNARSGATLEDVMPMRGGDTGDSDDGSEGADDTPDDTAGDDAADDGDGADGGEGADGADGGDDGTSGSSGDSTGATAAGGDDDADGCGCRTRPRARTWWLLALLPLVGRRRRLAAPPGRPAA